MEVQWMPLIVITLGYRLVDDDNRLMTINNERMQLVSIYTDAEWKFRHKKQKGEL
jgi:hypothetical protein